MSAEIAWRIRESAEKDKFYVERRLQDAEYVACMVCSNAQQYAGKMLKAVYVINDVEYPYTSDIGRLVKGCVENGWIDCTEEELAAADVLTEHARGARYDEYYTDMTKVEAEASVIGCNKLMDMLERHGYEAERIDTQHLFNAADTAPAS